MPTWIQALARHQPITPVVESLRGLLLGTPVGSNPWVALGWCSALVVAAGIASQRIFARRTA